MGTTHHASAAERHAQKIRQNDRGRAVLTSYRDLIAQRHAAPYVDAIGQPYRGWTDGQIAALAKVDAFIAAGHVRKVAIPVDAIPGRDSDRNGNAVKLRNGLPAEFTADILPGLSHDGDGSLQWAESHMPWCDDSGKEWDEPLTSWHTSAPLEIGYTDASRTLLHLLEAGVVARWPYRSTDVWLFWFASFEQWHAWRCGIGAGLAA